MALQSTPGRAGGLISYFTRHRTLANLLFVLLIVAGLVASTRIRAQYFPDVIVAEVQVSVAWSGAGAEDVDRAIVQVLEPALLAVDGVTNAVSRAGEGSGRIVLEFEPGTDLTQAAEDVQTAVNSVNNLPSEAEEPRITRSQWRDQVTDVVITGPVGVDQLARFADEFVGRLFQIGVTRTTIRGMANPQTVVEVPSVALIQHDITMREIATAIGAAVQTNPAGNVGDGSARVRTGTERRSASEIAGVVLRSLPDGTKLTVGDIATISAVGADSGRASFVGANPAMTVRVDRNAEGDAIRMQAGVADVAAEMQLSLPPGVTVDLVRARAEQITDRLYLLLDNALSGLALVVLLLFLFLNARTALWVAAGIPVAMLAAVAVMYAAGLTLNMISLFALIIMLGIVVDDAIVVGEHADFRGRTLGEDPVVAAERGAMRMAQPVIASTLTTVIAFFGLVAIGGRFGGMIRDIPFTVIAVLIASLVECFLILPNHMAHAIAKARQEKWYDWPSRQVNRGMVWFGENAVKPLMRLLIVARYPVLAASVALFAASAALFIRGDLPFRFFNAPEQASVTGNFSMLPGADRSDTLELMREVQRAAEAVGARFEAEHGVNPITFAMAEIGGSGGRGLASAEGKDADQLGSISIELINPDARPYSSNVFVSALQDEVRGHPLMEELSFRGGRFGPGGDALAIDLYGAEAAGLKAAAEALKARLAIYSEVSALEDSLAYDKEELILNLTPLGQSLGFAIDDLGRTLRDRLNGIEAATYPDGPRSASIRLELPPRELTADFLDATLMRTRAGSYVPLADIVTVEQRAGFSTIRRENGLRIVSVSGDLAEDNPARAAEIQATIRETILPEIEEQFGIESRQGGLVQQQNEFLGDAGTAVILCLLGIYLCLAWIFASWTRPLVVMSVIPFGLIGAMWGHFHWGVPLSMFSIVGLIGMSGIIINDSIVLVSTIDEYAEKRGLIPAIIDGVADRFRAVLLTTMTTVFGLSPLLFERSSQAEFLKPTVITLVYGLAFGMLLVLVMVPALMAVQADIGKRFRALSRGTRRGPRLVLLASAGVLLALFAVTLAPAVLAPWVEGVMPGLPALSRSVAFGVFALGAGVVTLAAYWIACWTPRRR
ncbi:MAG: efflux RND transporter permease subunit [Pseudotabrizicola sp.]|uniref:efflux RND transporter permease subunit n=1 Tax=Pseudotabrizicola sp. TaxID=2939647 RepID=UPI00271A23D5|nr:efflux RND transporter permease subunit [Pseudotabrizicola sp.]MDO8882289.1 efflux RND transporter permease subunit [Pseudotabrizicola sp.]MDP2079932.1 efflux RND transporter permease subunit [Pseudotabrizicola sp.]MDZ7575671.1 efflux RND transporter permease subunit [Pseudotabrizicola sp.]